MANKPDIKAVCICNTTGKHSNLMGVRKRRSSKPCILRLPKAPLFRLASRAKKTVPYDFYLHNKADIDYLVQEGSMHVEFIPENIEESKKSIEEPTFESTSKPELVTEPEIIEKEKSKEVMFGKEEEEEEEKEDIIEKKPKKRGRRKKSKKDM